METRQRTRLFWSLSEIMTILCGLSTRVKYIRVARLNVGERHRNSLLI